MVFSSLISFAPLVQCMVSYLTFDQFKQMRKSVQEQEKKGELWSLRLFSWICVCL